MSAGEVAAASVVHVDHQGLPVVQDVLARLPRPARPIVSYDAGNLDARRCPPYVDVYAPTLTTLRQCYGTDGTAAALDAALADGARWVVATDGAGGAVAASAKAHYRVASHEVEIRSTLAARDVFHGALLAAKVRGMRLADAVAYANAAAAVSCGGLDGPWVVLSIGVPHDLFPRAVELACAEGRVGVPGRASGLAAGRRRGRHTGGAGHLRRPASSRTR